ncbi:MAG: hypothetical protein FGM54_06250 [Chitinophagaceae bacterium]|nr:hypothetical protein [Chitinophagaceae bacterium]
MRALFFIQFKIALYYLVHMVCLRWAIGFLGCVLCMACTQGNRAKTPAVAWYWWKTVYSPDATELAYFKNCGSKRLAVHLFDVDSSVLLGVPAPKAVLKQLQSLPDSFNWVPVVYITRASLLNPGNLDSLASHIANLVNGLCKGKAWTEIQWDHDWTGTTRSNYFSLLRILKKLPVFQQKQFTATIRLHQLQQVQPELIPPVDKGLLMLYNMGNLTRFESKNSIYEEETLAQYAKFLKPYPLSLDWALPVFAWGVQFRQGRFVAIMNGLRSDGIAQSGMADTLPDGRFRCRKAGYLNGFPVQAGDIIRTEACKVRDLKKIVRTLNAECEKVADYVYFFDWQKQHLPYFSPYDIQQIAQTH